MSDETKSSKVMKYVLYGVFIVVVLLGVASAFVDSGSSSNYEAPTQSTNSSSSW